MKPRWQEIEKENPWLETKYYELDDNLEIAKKYGIEKEIPVFVFLDKNDQEILRLNGEQSKKHLLRVINENRDK